jgi:hypothetical protein
MKYRYRLHAIAPDGKPWAGAYDNEPAAERQALAWERAGWRVQRSYRDNTMN